MGVTIGSSHMEIVLWERLRHFLEFFSAILALFNLFWCCGDVTNQEFSTYGRKKFVGPLEFDQS